MRADDPIHGALYVPSLDHETLADSVAAADRMLAAAAAGQPHDPESTGDLMTELDAVLEMPDGHHARVLTLGDRRMRVRYDDGDVRTVARPDADDPYLCKTCDEVVDPNVRHTHGCPMEDGDPCGSRRCNETGSCGA